MPKRRQPTANLFQTDMNRAVNSQMVRTTSRNRKNPLPENLTHFNAVEPRQIRSILKQDVKDARYRMIESASSQSKGKKAFWADSDLRKQRHTACGAAKGNKALRFLTAGSRDLASDILPGCYFDPKGSRIRKGRGTAVPLIRRHYQMRGGSARLTVRDLEPYTLRLRHIIARTPHLVPAAANEMLGEAEDVMRMANEGFDIDETYLGALRSQLQSIINNFPTGHQESKE
jgi:hypothetical protein